MHITCGSILALVPGATADIHTGYNIVWWTRILFFTVGANLEMKNNGACPNHVEFNHVHNYVRQEHTRGVSYKILVRIVLIFNYCTMSFEMA